MKSRCQVLHGVALDAEVLVAPLAHVISVEVVFRNIYATQKGDTAVRDDYFAGGAWRETRVVNHGKRTGSKAAVRTPASCMRRNVVRLSRHEPTAS